MQKSFRPFATREDLQDLEPLFSQTHLAIKADGWIVTEDLDEKLQVHYKKGEKTFDILPLYDAHIEPYDGWCLEAMRHDADLDVCFIKDVSEIPYLLEYLNQEA